MREPVISYKTRCRFCGDFPKLYLRISGIPFAMDTVHTRQMTEYDLSTGRRLPAIREGKILRSSSVRGAASFSSWFFKKNKSDGGSYRVIVYCKCKRASWMFMATETMATYNRKLVTISPEDDFEFRRAYLCRFNLR